MKTEVITVIVEKKEVIIVIVVKIKVTVVIVVKIEVIVVIEVNMVVIEANIVVIEVSIVVVEVKVRMIKGRNEVVAMILDENIIDVAADHSPPSQAFPPLALIVEDTNGDIVVVVQEAHTVGHHLSFPMSLILDPTGNLPLLVVDSLLMILGGLDVDYIDT